MVYFYILLQDTVPRKARCLSKIFQFVGVIFGSSVMCIIAKSGEQFCSRRHPALDISSIFPFLKYNHVVTQL